MVSDPRKKHHKSPHENILHPTPCLIQTQMFYQQPFTEIIVAHYNIMVVLSKSATCILTDFSLQMAVNPNQSNVEINST